MARPASGTNLTIDQINRVLHSKMAELAALQRKRERLQKKLNLIDRHIERLGGSVTGGSGGGTRPRNEHNLPDTIESVLRDAGKPMKVGEIMDGVVAAGYRSTAANFRGLVNQTLIKERKRFGQVERGIYGLREVGKSKK